MSSAEPDSSSLRPNDAPGLRDAPPPSTKTGAVRAFHFVLSFGLVTACFIAVDSRCVVNQPRSIEPIWLIAAFGLHSIQLALWLGPLILTAASIPSFLGGWGIREGASAVLFGAAGLSGSRGLAVSVVYGVFGLVVGAAGLVVCWLAGWRDARETLA